MISDPKYLVLNSGINHANINWQIAASSAAVWVSPREMHPHGVALILKTKRNRRIAKEKQHE